jgi:putative component of membrane protein insertase Oxa1/YidC/SpoIIIJ protein YidD
MRERIAKVYKANAAKGDDFIPGCMLMITRAKSFVSILHLATLLANIISILIRGLRPLLGPASCRFHQGCTAYALVKLKTEPLPHALWNIGKRLFLCNPFW